METKTIGSVTTVTNVNASQYIPLTDASGNITKIALDNLKTSMLACMDLTDKNDGVIQKIWST